MTLHCLQSQLTGEADSVRKDIDTVNTKVWHRQVSYILSCILPNVPPLFGLVFYLCIYTILGNRAIYALLLTLFSPYPHPKEAVVQDQTNILFSSSAITYGSAYGEKFKQHQNAVEFYDPTALFLNPLVSSLFSFS